MRCLAWAKINLTLGVGPPEPAGSPRAGYHPIRSLVQAIDLCDEIEIDPLPGPAGGGGWAAVRAGVRLERRWSPDAPVVSALDWPEKEDLCVRAVRALEREVGRALRVRLRVTKRIPVGGGLGGGSSDAGAVLLGLRRAFELDVTDERLARVGSELGSDVAFFIDSHDPPRPARVEGFGERITRVEGRRGNLVLLLPPFGCPTREVYEAFDARRGWERGGPSRAALAEEAGEWFNALAGPACDVRPRLREIAACARAILGEAWPGSAPAVHVTGSGSTLVVPVGGDVPVDLEGRLGARVARARLVG